MKKLNDDAIQSLLEDKTLSNSPVLDQEQQQDYKMYQQLFEIVGTKPVDVLPADFAQKVASRIEHKQNRVRNIVFYFLIGLLSLLGMVMAINIFTIEFLLGLMHTVLKFKEIITFGVATFFLIQYFDKKYIRVL